MDELDYAYGSHWKQWLAAMAASLAMVVVGNEEFWIFETLRTVAPIDSVVREHMILIWTGFIIATICGVIGAILGAVLADKFGRRHTLLATSILAIIQTVGSYSISTVWSCVPRFIGEIGLGMTCVVVPLYLSEIADEKIRGAVMMLQIPFFFVGKLMAVGIGLLEFSVISLVFIGIFIAAFTWLPETPYYLASKKRYDAAAKSLAFYQNVKNVELIMKDVEENDNSDSQGCCNKIRELVRGCNGRGLIIIVFLIIAKWSEQKVDSRNNLTEFVSDILMSNSDHAKMIAHLTSLISSILILSTIDVIGRRSFLLCGTFIGFISIILLLILENYHQNQWIYHGFRLILHFCQLIIFSIPLVYVGELFSMNVKALAISIVTICNLLISFIILPVLEFTYGDPNSYVIGVLLFLAFPITFAFIPETKQKSLSDIHSEVAATTFHCRWLTNKLSCTDRTELMKK